jgi:hypothetical protein
VREGGYHLAFDRDSVLVDLLVECFAESDQVAGSIVRCQVFGIAPMNPEPHAVEKMKADTIDQPAAVGLIFGAEEDGGCKDAMKALNDPAIVTAVLGEAEEVEHLGGAVEADVSGFLLNSERRHPDRDQSVLTEGQTEFRVTGDIEKESAVAAGMNELSTGRAAKRNAAEGLAL